MGVSTRHTRRILAAYREKGAAAIAHGNRGRRPANATPKTTSTGVVRLAVKGGEIMYQVGDSKA